MNRDKARELLEKELRIRPTVKASAIFTGKNGSMGFRAGRYYAVTIVKRKGEVVSCEIVPGANATDAGYRPHWATCPQAGTFRATIYRKFDIKEPKARTIDTPRCTWKEGDCHE